MVVLWNSEKCDNLNDLDVDYVRHKLLDKKNLELDFALLIPTIVDMWRVTCDVWHVTCDMWHLFRDGGGGLGVEGGERGEEQINSLFQPALKLWNVKWWG